MNASFDQSRHLPSIQSFLTTHIKFNIFLASFSSTAKADASSASGSGSVSSADVATHDRFFRKDGLEGWFCRVRNVWRRLERQPGNFETWSQKTAGRRLS